MKCARAFAKHRKGKIRAVALAYSVEGADVPLLGVLLVEPTDRDALNPAEWDGFDDDEELELETPAHVGATLGGLDHVARRELFVAATIEMRRVLGALCFATDYECSELDANLAAANPVAGESSLGADSRWPRVPRRGGG